MLKKSHILKWMKTKADYSILEKPEHESTCLILINMWKFPNKYRNRDLFKELKERMGFFKRQGGYEMGQNSYVPDQTEQFPSDKEDIHTCRCFNCGDVIKDDGSDYCDQCVEYNVIKGEDDE